MKKMSEEKKEKPYLTGKQFIMGDYAIAEAALAAGCNFFAGYPITPASKIAERMSIRLPQFGYDYIQMEDEIASMAAIIGGSCSGAKSMTATSGPGISLMNENIGLAAMYEAPCVIINVMRGGPSTGMPTLTSQGDIMQAKYGSHGDYWIAAYAPSTVQEAYDLTIKAFNVAEKYRTPVILLADQIVGTMTANLVMHHPDDLTIENRPRPEPGLENYLPYDSNYLVPPMAIAGDGYNVLMTGLTHDERGYPNAVPETQEKMLHRMEAKFMENLDDILLYEEMELDDAELAIVCYGTETRSVIEAVEEARSEGIKVGMLQMKSIWPFPQQLITDLSKKVKQIMVPEGNTGQYVHPVREYAECDVVSFPNYTSQIHQPAEILAKIKELMK